MLGFGDLLSMPLVVTIPRRWMISIRTCASSDSLVTCLADNGIHVPVYGHEAQLALALALYNELYVLEPNVQTFRVWGSYDIIYSLLGSRSEWADYLQSLPQKTVPIGLFWGYKYSEDDSPDREAIDWKGNHDLRPLFVNPETGVERLASLLDPESSPLIFWSLS
jgi:hypothetical protein